MTKHAERARWVSYLRVNTVEQAEKELSLIAQRHAVGELGLMRRTQLRSIGSPRTEESRGLVQRRGFSHYRHVLLRMGSRLRTTLWGSLADSAPNIAPSRGALSIEKSA